MSSIKEELIQIATNTIQHAGVYSLTMRELGETVGIKSSSVMYHFKNKSGLINELVKQYNIHFFNALNDLNLQYSDKRERLDKFVDIFENALAQDKFCLCGMMAAEKENIDEISIQSTQNFFKDTQSWITANLQNNSEDMAKVIISSLEGAILLDKLDESSERIMAVRKWIKTL